MELIYESFRPIDDEKTIGVGEQLNVWVDAGELKGYAAGAKTFRDLDRFFFGAVTGLMILASPAWNSERRARSSEPPAALPNVRRHQF